ncbi:uncharacterized protein BJX67DRAFT_348504 [Aspergillus lucknowensis]|uniref:Uncharacterized protein n=1 Tax=Aspergillus lucknowensis TaxID=176173 RepID=A0ABR4LWV2_9EURO
MALDIMAGSINGTGNIIFLVTVMCLCRYLVSSLSRGRKVGVLVGREWVLKGT